MPFFSKLLIVPKALRQLGARPLFLYAWYQLKLRSGILWLQTLPGKSRSNKQSFELQTIIVPENKERIKGLLGNQVGKIFEEADEILGGQVRLFGGEPRKLELSPSHPLKHWTQDHSRMRDGRDIKPIWEAGRFGWATVLARAYWLSGDERYAEGFWQRAEEFINTNPANLGPHWSSAQEVALRLISWAFCYRLVAESKATTEKRKQMLAHSVIEHAERIPPTLDYAKSQNNNHLLSEALGLCTAAAMLPSHSKADEWNKLGIKCFIEGVDAQIHDDGAYAQNSSNYHRLMLQLGIWAQTMIKDLPATTLAKLAKATDWLLRIMEHASGHLPNLGPNDGAYILPLSILPFADYRPTLQAASRAFRAGPALEPGIWDEMSLWLGMNPAAGLRKPPNQATRIEGKDSWAYFRVAEFKERPGHADQLQFDLWWQGLNIVQDAGSFVYTGDAPWDNTLASGKLHNGMVVNNREPMTKAGRFLWLDWAQGKIIKEERSKTGVVVLAEHNGYDRLRVSYRRQVASDAKRWVVTDRLTPKGDNKRETQAQLHWLLPDWDWHIENEVLTLRSPHGLLKVDVDVSVGDEYYLQLIRAGELVHGKGETDPVLGWVSRTYGVKIPALSFVVKAEGLLPITLTSTFTLPDK